MIFCSHCGEKVVNKIPEGDNRQRFVCTSCNLIHYQNPRIIAGCIAEFEGKILLCKRAIEPRHGLWTLPAGFMENQETTLEAAKRETFEEAKAEINNSQLFCTISIPHISQVYIMYRGELVNGYAHPGTESLETDLYSEDEIPWGELAFPVITESLRLYFSDKNNGQFNIYNGEMRRDENQKMTTHIYNV